MERAGNQRTGRMDISIPVAASSIVNEARLVAINESGYASEAKKEAGNIIAGCCIKLTDNSKGTDGEARVLVRRGAFVWKNDGTIKETDIMKDCYVSDAQTVTITSTGSSKAGVIIGVEPDGVIVETM